MHSRNFARTLLLGFSCGGLFLCASVLGSASLPGCATSTKGLIDDEAGAEGGLEGGPNAEGGPGEGGLGDGGGEAGPGGPRIACGSTFCRSDEKCVQSACTLDCAGTKVPGDYANVTSAITALAATGADVTICVGAVQVGEVVNISDPAAHNKNLRVVGLIPQQVTFGSVTVGTGFSNVTLEGFGTSSSMSVTSATNVTLRALKLSSISSYALQLRGSAVAGTTSTYVVDGCDIGSTSTSAYGIYVDNSATSTFNVNITNSYIHGGAYGIYAYGANTAFQLGILNNTIDHQTSYGLYVSSAPTGQVGYVNNIISNSTMFGVYVATGLTAVTHSNNALFGNMTNYSGIAVVDPTGPVTADCMLVLSTGIPQTKPGSPCRGAGKAAGAPPVDYWNASRGASVDIGAVQGP